MAASATKVWMAVAFLTPWVAGAAWADIEKTEYRAPADEMELQYWLANMQVHGFTPAERMLATGLSREELAAAMGRQNPADRLPAPLDRLHVLPYPGGRHPRIGFRDGAIRPQRETKFSVFAPWTDAGYVVVDVPEAIWCDQGLLYLAHTHVPTLWSAKGVTLERREWTRHDDGSIDVERELPNHVKFGARVVPRQDHVEMELWLINGSDRPLSDLRVQMCAMLGHLKEFEAQSNDNKLFESPYAACRNENGTRWVIMASEPVHRAWGNAPCPCLHSDPKFPDCAPGQKQTVWGRLWYYEGSDIAAEIRRVDATGWRDRKVQWK